ncbi:unnamed protein product, partial [Ixodes hexagonus]
MARPNQKSRKGQKRKRVSWSRSKDDPAHSNVSSGQPETARTEDISASVAGFSGLDGNMDLSSGACKAEKENRHCADITDTKAPSTSVCALSKHVPETSPRKCSQHQNKNEVIVGTPPKRQRLHLGCSPGLSPLQVRSQSHNIAHPEVPSFPVSPGGRSISEQSNYDDPKEQVSAIIDKLPKAGGPDSPKVDLEKYSTAPTNPNGPLKGTKVFVEVISDTEDISNIVALYLEKLGATVRRTMSSTVTLVVFSRGRVSTRRKALQWNIPLVGLLWVEECLSHYYFAPPENFPAKVSNNYDCPILSKRIRKPRSWLTNKPGYNIGRKRKGPRSSQKKGSPVTPPAMIPSLLTPCREPASHQLLATGTPKKTVSNAKVKTKVLAMGSPPLSDRSLRTKLLKSRAESARRLALLGTPCADVCPSSMDKGTRNCGSQDDGLATVVEKQARKRRLFVPVDKGPSASPEPLIIAKKAQRGMEDDSDEELSPLSVRTGYLSYLSSCKATEGMLKSGIPEDFLCKKRLELATDGKAGSSSASTVARWHTSPLKALSDESDSNCNTRKGRTSLEEFTVYLCFKSKKNKRERASVAWMEDAKYFVSSSVDGAPSIVMTNLQPSDMEAIRAIVSKLGRFQLENNVTGRTTHIICGDKLRTLKLLFGMAKGCWVLPTKWVYRSLECGHWVDEDPFELTDMFPAVRASRLERQKAKRRKRKKGLLTGTDSFYVSRKSSPPHSEMCALIEILGGKV